VFGFGNINPTLGQHSSSPACTALSTALRRAGHVASLLHDSRFRRLPLHRLEVQFFGSYIVPFSFLIRIRVASSPASSC